MTPELKACWVAALRSGRYAQGRCQLRDDTDSDRPRYCCLGVLADVARLEQKMNMAFLTEENERRVGLSREYQENLSLKNDNYMRFTAIADWIETNL